MSLSPGQVDQRRLIRKSGRVETEGPGSTRDVDATRRGVSKILYETFCDTDSRSPFSKADSHESRIAAVPRLIVRSPRDNNRRCTITRNRPEDPYRSSAGVALSLPRNSLWSRARRISRGYSIAKVRPGRSTSTRIPTLWPSQSSQCLFKGGTLLSCARGNRTAGFDRRYSKGTFYRGKKRDGVRGVLFRRYLSYDFQSGGTGIAGKREGSRFSLNKVYPIPPGATR